MMHFARLLCVALALAAPARAQEGTPPEPEGYRTGDYRSRTPATLKGARVLTTEQAEALWRAGTAVFVDVMPQAPRPSSLPPGTVWRDKPRLTIPGSLWLPDTGYGALAPATEDYLRRGLEKASGGDREKLIVFFCLADCWMSWNAAKRARSYGYPNIAWYPEGTDGWEAEGLPLAEAKPEPRGGE
jgi:PQQ-dependent catabolism-associated CXXCW motif protein